MSNTNFKWRGFISFGLFISFLIMTITGVVLYFAPPGRVAKWVVWDILGLTKEQWQAQHTLFSLFFLILSIFHIFSLNWKTFLHYIKKKSREGIHMKKELIASILVSFVIFFGTLVEIAPFHSVMVFGEYLTESWEVEEEKAPVSHTEEMTLNEISETILSVPVEDLLDKLKKAGITVTDQKQILKEIAEENKKSPHELYLILSEGEKVPVISIDTLKSKGGLGRKTIREVAHSIGMDVKIVLDALESQGITVSETHKIKDVAEESGKTPLEIITIIENIK